EALQAAQEAAALYRQLAQINPQAFLPDLAMSLNNLGVLFSELGRREEALQAAQEAVEIRRQLAQVNPQAFLPDLARSLGSYGSILLALERPAEAAEAFAEGARLLLPFARTLPQVFSGLLQALLGYYLRACQAAGQAPQPALLQEAAEILGGEVALLHPAVLQLALLLLGVVAVVRGDAGDEVKAQVQGALGAMKVHEDWRALATALERLLAGERDPQALTAGLEMDEVDQQALALTLAVVESDEGLQALVALAQAAVGKR
ncbi:MAG: tetratricopeptide repeat protein, partial [Anaerolineales bacterium]